MGLHQKVTLTAWGRVRVAMATPILCSRAVTSASPRSRQPNKHEKAMVAQDVRKIKKGELICSLDSTIESNVRVAPSPRDWVWASHMTVDHGV